MVSVEEASKGWDTNESRRICERDLKRLREPENLRLGLTSFEGLEAKTGGEGRVSGCCSARS